MCACEHHAIMMRLVTIAIDEDDIARLNQGLHYNFISCRGAVGNEVSTFRSKCTRREYLCLLDRTMGLQ